MRRLADFVVRWPWVVIGLWAVIVVALPLSSPSLDQMAQKNPLTMLPSDAPSSITARKMTEAFHESGSEDLLLVVLTSDKGLGPADEAVYRKLVDTLRQDSRDVLMLQDFVSTPPLRSALTSEDHKAWVLPVGLAGEVGTPRSYDAFNRVSDIVEHAVTGTPLAANLAGPAATVGDLTVAGAHDRLPIEMAIGVLVLIVLLLVYRSAVTMLLPLITIGLSLVIAQSLVAGYSQVTSTGVSNQSIVFLSAIMAGAGTDYAVFLISRYHDYLRSGADCDQAVKKAMASIGKVIAASAATVGITFLLISFARMGIYKTVGVSSAIGIGVAFLAALTLLPAILVLAGPRGLVKPRRELTARFWRRSGIRIVRRPRAHLVASVLVLIVLASCAGLVRYNYDDRKALPPSAPSSIGYAALDRHFPVNQSIPEYILIQSPRDLRTPQALADLEQLADRVSQLPNIAVVTGITRPTGTVPEQFRATYQAGAVGSILARGSTLIKDQTNDLDRLVDGAGTLAKNLSDVRGQVGQLANSIQGLIDAFSSLKTQYGGDTLVKEVDTAAKLVDHVNSLGNAMGWNFSAVKDMFGWIGPVLAALQGNPVCDADPSCSATRGRFEQMAGERNQADIEAINDLVRQLQTPPDKQTLNAAISRLRAAMTNVAKVMHSMGLDKPGGLEANLNGMRRGADRFAGGSKEVADAVAQLVDQVKQLAGGLSESAAFLLSLKHDAAQPAMAGFNIPSKLLHLAEFQNAAKVFMSPDGHSVRYLVQTKLNPFSTEAMDQVNAITATARGAQPNTALADATVSMAGYTVTLKDTRDYYEHDIRFIIVATLLVVLLTLIALLRAIVAPLYLVASVVISYLSAVGIGVLVFQFILGQQLHWSVPPLAFVVLIAVGADYNMLLVSRMRDESPHSARYGVIRTLGSTGGVITAAGLIFAASMCGLLFSSIGTVIQGGFVIGVGILLDTFLVRTVTVPAIAALVGRANWWPSRVGGGQRAANDVCETGAAERSGVGMKKVLAGITTVITIGATQCFGAGTVSADDTPPPVQPGPGLSSDGTAYALGGAHVLGIPYDEYIRREGAEWFPSLKRLNVRYPAGQVQGHVLERLFPGIGRLNEYFPGAGFDGPSLGESIGVGADNLDAEIRKRGRGVAIGLSEGCLVLDEEQARLANDPTAPPRDQLSFATFGDPIARTPFGQSFLTAQFPVGSVAPALDYRIPPPFESQYDTRVFVSAFDSIADFPDRPDNLFALGNALMGLATGHTAVAFTSPSQVPPQNIRTTINSKGATTTTYLIPEKHLPLVMGLTYIGIDEDTLNKLDAILIPRVSAGYSRNDDPATAPIQVDPVHGFDPLAITEPANEATFGGADPLSQMLNSAGAAFSHPGA